MAMKCLYLLIFAAVSMFVSACQPAAAPVAISNRPVSINDVRQPGEPSKPVPDMSWTMLNGDEGRIADHRDKVLILDFWATYCGPCRDEVPHLNSLQAKYGSDRLQVIGLNVGGDEDRPKIAPFMKDLNASYTVAIPEQALMDYMSKDDDRIPQTAVFDKQGQLVLRVVGYDSRVGDQLDRAVETALAQ
jgi:thiol-disulfide isomerase/thioredoxin